MAWFKKKKAQEKRICDKEAAVSIAVQRHKKTTQAAIKETTQSAAKLNRSLKRNHIMFKIHIATTGGHR